MSKFIGIGNGTTYTLLITLNLSTLILVDGLQIEQEDRYDKVDLEPVLTTLARNHAP